MTTTYFRAGAGRMNVATLTRLLLGVLVLVGCVLHGTSASASSTIRNDAGAPGFLAEIEPHAVLTPFRPPTGTADGGLGAGLLVAFNVAPLGFIPHLNDSVSVGVGLDWVRYFGAAEVAGECAEWIGSGEDAICTRVRGGAGAGHYFYVPAVMQWNFYLSNEWSVFGEPGIAIYLWNSSVNKSFNPGATPVFNAGARWHFSPNAHLLFRVGYPYTTVGLSFYL